MCRYDAETFHTGGMSDQVWINNRQPQTLYIAQVIMYFRGVLGVLFGGLFGVGQVALC